MTNLKKVLTATFVIICIIISMYTHIGYNEVQAEMQAKHDVGTFNPIAANRGNYRFTTLGE